MYNTIGVNWSVIGIPMIFSGEVPPLAQYDKYKISIDHEM